MPAQAVDSHAAPPLQIDLAQALAAAATAQEPDTNLSDEAETAGTKPKFAAKDSWRWYLQAGVGKDFEGLHTMTLLGGGGVSYYIVDNLALMLELNALYYDQPGKNAFGVNFALLFRWHFLARDTFSLYIDVGAGILGTTEAVPSPTLEDPLGGTSFNFTPQAGFGASWQVAQDIRLLTGVRWHHVSNARTSDNNPGLDSVLFYVGASFPF